MSKQDPTEFQPTLATYWPTYRKFVLFFHFATLTGLAVAFALILYQAWGSWRWQDSVVVLALLCQAGIYLRLLVFNRQYPWPNWLLPVYFCSSLLLWLVEVALNPYLFWLGFPYMGQMYGLLSLAPAILGTIVIFLVITWVNTGFTFSRLSYPEILNWLSVLLLLIFINHLLRTNRERAYLIDKLRRAHRDLQAARQEEAELAVLRERERLARDMHDSLGHNLVALSVQLEAVQRLYRVDPEAASAVLNDLKRLTRGSMAELRRTLAGLRTPGLGDRSLQDALQALCEDFRQRNQVQVHCAWDDGVGSLPALLAEALWRVVQEAFMNIEKHAAASQVDLRLQLQTDGVCLSIEDNGCGFDPKSAIPPGHYGLAGMRERVEGVGGTLAIHCQPGSGTRLEVHIPTLGRSI
jgi:signal transduction histidine kinase